MISFRFHVVSITAIFLAIAVGVVVGSTYVDGAVVTGLRNRINTVEQRAEDARDENNRLESELGTAREYIDLSSEYAVTDRLIDVPVLVAAIRGIDEASVQRMVVLARRAGASVPGIVWLEPRWALEGDEDAAALADIVGGSASSERAVMWANAWAAIAEELQVAPDTEAEGAVDPDATPTQERPAVLDELEAAGFISVDALDDDRTTLADLAGAGPSVLLVTGTRAEEDVAPSVPLAVRATLDVALPTVVADVHVEAPEAPPRASELLELLAEDVREAIVIVDDADREEGRAAAVLALHDAAAGLVGFHYGYGDGADAVLPQWSAP